MCTFYLQRAKFDLQFDLECVGRHIFTRETEQSVQNRRYSSSFRTSFELLKMGVLRKKELRAKHRNSYQARRVWENPSPSIRPGGAGNLTAGCLVVLLSMAESVHNYVTKRGPRHFLRGQGDTANRPHQE